MRKLRSARWLVLALLLSIFPAASHAGVFISVNFGPPVLPVYVQPVCPQPNLLWTPGYWAYGDDGYYWVPGAWVPAPYEGALWTPGYWGWSGGLYVFHDGYWGPHVGYYGGVNYGFGYMGIGFAGGEWHGHDFAYNTAVMHVNTTIIHNTYVNETIVHQNTIVNNTHVAYSGGPGGIQHQPTPQEQQALHESHVAPTSFQQQHVQAARVDKTSYAKVNGGRPQNLAVSRPLPEEHHAAPAGIAASGHTNPTPASNGRPLTTNGTNTYSRPQTAAPTNNGYHATTQPNSQYHPQTQPNSQYHPQVQPKTESRPQAQPKPQPKEKEPKR